MNILARQLEKRRWHNHNNIFLIVQTILRRRRFRFIQRIIASLTQPFSLLDVGGTQEFWEMMQYTEANIKIIIYNLHKIETSYPNMVSMAGDARDMHSFADQQFTFVFSNSVIEHVGDIQQQKRMAHEIQRVGQRYCVQTPNRYFPLEPHVLLPFFQFLPFSLQVCILTHIRTPWGWKLENKQQAEAYVREIRLLSEKELRQLFPGANIYKEKFLGLTKSFIVYKC